MRSKTFEVFALALISVGALLAPPGIALADSGREGNEQEVAGYRVGLRFPVEPVTTGEHEIEVSLHDPAGAPVGDAVIFVSLQAHVESEMDSPAGSDTGGHDAGAMEGHGQSEMDSHGSSVHAEADSTGHAEPAAEALEAGAHAGEYVGRVGIDEPGEARLKVSFTVEGVEREVEFAVHADQAGPNWAVLGGFAGVNATVVLTAAILKRKSTEA